MRVILFFRCNPYSDARQRMHHGITVRRRQMHGASLLAQLGLQFLDDTSTVTMLIDPDAKPLQHRQPHVAQRGILCQHDVLTKFKIGTAAGDHGRAIGQVVNRADV